MRSTTLRALRSFITRGLTADPIIVVPLLRSVHLAPGVGQTKFVKLYLILRYNYAS